MSEYRVRWPKSDGAFADAMAVAYGRLMLHADPLPGALTSFAYGETVYQEHPSFGRMYGDVIDQVGNTLHVINCTVGGQVYIGRLCLDAREVKVLPKFQRRAQALAPQLGQDLSDSPDVRQ